jgi:hypothetical protein
MKTGFWLGTSLFFLLSISLGMASPLEDKVNGLKEALKAEASTAPPPAPSVVRGDTAVMNTEAQNEALDQITSGQPGSFPFNNATPVITQILMVHPSAAVQKAGRELLEEINTERKAKADAEAVEVTGVLKRLAAVIAQATKPSDLDEILIELQKYQNPGYSNPMTTEDQQRLVQEANMAFQFATGWQDYLSSMGTGNIEQARNELSNLAQNSFGVTIVPRSHLLELMNPPQPVSVMQTGTLPPPPPPAAAEPTVDDILDQVKTLDQMEGALKQIESLKRTLSPEENVTVGTLQDYVECYHDIKAGLPAALNLTNGFQNLRGHVEITRQLWLMALQTLFKSSRGALVPASDEKPLDYVNRVIASAAGLDDWELLKIALVTKENVTRSTQFGLYVSEPTIGLDSLISALNQEAAGQYSLAVTSYEAALKSPSLEIPAKMIGEKLAAIQKDHPADFQSGYQQTVAPAPFYSTPYIYSNPFANPFRPGMPGYQFPNAPPPAILSIPGRTNAAPSTPNPTPVEQAPTKSNAVLPAAKPGK